MAEREIVRLQGLIEKMRGASIAKDTLLSELEDSLAAARKEAEVLRKQRSVLPFFPAIESSNEIEENDSNGYRRLLETRLSQQAHELACMHAVLKEKNNLIEELSKQNADLERELSRVQRQSERTKIFLEQVNSLNKLQESQIQKINEKWNASVSEKNNLIADISRLEETIEGLREENGRLIEEYSLKLEGMLDTKKKEVCIPKDEDILKEMNELLEHLQKELSDRNEELMLLTQADPQDISQVSASKHTITQLKKQIQAKTSLVMQMVRKLQEAEEAIQLFSEAKVRYESRFEELSQLKSKYEQAIDKISYLEGQRRRLEQLIEQNKFSIQSNEDRMLILLEENEVCHQFLFSQHGENYRRFISKSIEEAQKRRDERDSLQQWASFKELLAMNDRLMLRVCGRREGTSR